MYKWQNSGSFNSTYCAVATVTEEFSPFKVFFYFFFIFLKSPFIFLNFTLIDLFIFGCAVLLPCVGAAPQLWSVDSRTRELWCRSPAALWPVVSSWTRDWTCVPCVSQWILHHWTTREIIPERKSLDHANYSSPFFKSWLPTNRRVLYIILYFINFCSSKYLMKKNLVASLWLS